MARATRAAAKATDTTDAAVTSDITTISESQPKSRGTRGKVLAKASAEPAAAESKAAPMKGKGRGKKAGEVVEEPEVVEEEKEEEVAPEPKPVSMKPRSRGKKTAAVVEKVEEVAPEPKAAPIKSRGRGKKAVEEVNEEPVLSPAPVEKRKRATRCVIFTELEEKPAKKARTARAASVVSVVEPEEIIEEVVEKVEEEEKPAKKGRAVKSKKETKVKTKKATTTRAKNSTEEELPEPIEVEEVAPCNEPVEVEQLKPSGRAGRARKGSKAATASVVQQQEDIMPEDPEPAVAAEELDVPEIVVAETNEEETAEIEDPPEKFTRRGRAKAEASTVAAPELSRASTRGKRKATVEVEEPVQPASKRGKTAKKAVEIAESVQVKVVEPKKPKATTKAKVVRGRKAKAALLEPEAPEPTEVEAFEIAEPEVHESEMAEAPLDANLAFPQHPIEAQAEDPVDEAEAGQADTSEVMPADEALASREAMPPNEVPASPKAQTDEEAPASPVPAEAESVNEYEAHVLETIAEEAPSSPEITKVEPVQEPEVGTPRLMLDEPSPSVAEVEEAFFVVEKQVEEEVIIVEEQVEEVSIIEEQVEEVLIMDEQVKEVMVVVGEQSIPGQTPIHGSVLHTSASMQSSPPVATPSAQRQTASPSAFTPMLPSNLAASIALTPVSMQNMFITPNVVSVAETPGATPVGMLNLFDSPQAATVAQTPVSSRSRRTKSCLATATPNAPAPASAIQTPASVSGFIADTPASVRHLFNSSLASARGSVLEGDSNQSALPESPFVPPGDDLFDTIISETPKAKNVTAPQTPAFEINEELDLLTDDTLTVSTPKNIRGASTEDGSSTVKHQRSLPPTASKENESMISELNDAEIAALDLPLTNSPVSTRRGGRASQSPVKGSFLSSPIKHNRVAALGGSPAPTRKRRVTENGIVGEQGDPSPLKLSEVKNIYKPNAAESVPEATAEPEPGEVDNEEEDVTPRPLPKPTPRRRSSRPTLSPKKSLRGRAMTNAASPVKLNFAVLPPVMAVASFVEVEDVVEEMQMRDEAIVEPEFVYSLAEEEEMQTPVTLKRKGRPSKTPAQTPTKTPVRAPRTTTKATPKTVMKNTPQTAVKSTPETVSKGTPFVAQTLDFTPSKIALPETPITSPWKMPLPESSPVIGDEDMSSVMKETPVKRTPASSMIRDNINEDYDEEEELDALVEALVEELPTSEQDRLESEELEEVEEAAHGLAADIVEDFVEDIFMVLKETIANDIAAEMEGKEVTEDLIHDVAEVVAEELAEEVEEDLTMAMAEDMVDQAIEDDALDHEVIETRYDGPQTISIVAEDEPTTPVRSSGDDGDNWVVLNENTPQATPWKPTRKHLPEHLTAMQHLTPRKDAPKTRAFPKHLEVMQLTPRVKRVGESRIEENPLAAIALTPRNDKLKSESIPKHLAQMALTPQKNPFAVGAGQRLPEHLSALAVTPRNDALRVESMPKHLAQMNLTPRVQPFNAINNPRRTQPPPPPPQQQQQQTVAVTTSTASSPVTKNKDDELPEHLAAMSDLSPQKEIPVAARTQHKHDFESKKPDSRHSINILADKSGNANVKQARRHTLSGEVDANVNDEKPAKSVSVSKTEHPAARRTRLSYLGAPPVVTEQDVLVEQDEITEAEAEEEIALSEKAMSEIGDANTAMDVDEIITEEVLLEETPETESEGQTTPVLQETTEMEPTPRSSNGPEEILGAFLAKHAAKKAAKAEKGELTKPPTVATAPVNTNANMPNKALAKSKIAAPSFTESTSKKGKTASKTVKKTKAESKTEAKVKSTPAESIVTEATTSAAAATDVQALKRPSRISALPIPAGRSRIPAPARKAKATAKVTLPEPSPPKPVEEILSAYPTRTNDELKLSQMATRDFARTTAQNTTKNGIFQTVTFEREVQQKDIARPASPDRKKRATIAKKAREARERVAEETGVMLGAGDELDFVPRVPTPTRKTVRWKEELEYYFENEDAKDPYTTENVTSSELKSLLRPTTPARPDAAIKFPISQVKITKILYKGEED